MASRSATGKLSRVSVINPWSRIISKEQPFSDCVILKKDAFDPDAVFLDDIVDDQVLPYLSLSVDGLNEPGDRTRKNMELGPQDAANEDASDAMPDTVLDPEQLEVYGWESSFWIKLKGYLGL